MLKLLHKKDIFISTCFNVTGVEVKFKNCLYPVLINPNQVTELVSTKITDGGLRVGAAVTLSNLETILLEQISQQPGMCVIK